MGRLIDADKLKRKCQKVATEAWKMKIKASAEVIMNQFIDFIDEADAVDAVPVRCKDCKWYQPDADKWCGYFECMGFEPDDYCSQGERKDGEHDRG